MKPASRSYADVLAFMYRRLPRYQRQGSSSIKKDLTNIKRLCHLLGHPHRRFAAIHVAGTNGKGSVSHMVASVLQSAGLRVGLYTSPHYVDFRERIKINGQYISEEEVISFVDRIAHSIERIRPSFFEMSVAMAFDHFCRGAVDFAVVETGLGGRLDSTNVLDPVLSVITNISYDHQDMLGDTLPEIAREKAGIIKAAVPVVVGERDAETWPVFAEVAEQRESPLYDAGQLVQLCEVSMSLEHTEASYDHAHQMLPIRCDLGGQYQQANLTTALAALRLLEDAGHVMPSPETIQSGLASVRANTRFMGRWQILGRDPLIIADSAHNVGGLMAVREQLTTIPRRTMRVVLGVVKDKHLADILPLLPPSAIYYFVAADLPRSLAVGALQQEATGHGLRGSTYDSVEEGYRAAVNDAHREDLIFVGGSTYVVAEVLGVWSGDR